MASSRELKVVILGDSTQAQKAFSQIESSAAASAGKLEAFGTKLSAAGDRMMAVGAKLTVGVTAPLALLGKKAFDAASDLAESASKVGQVFGDWAIDIEQFAQGAAKSLGISRQAALEAAGTFGNLFSAMGLEKGVMTDMSTGLVKLSSDLASFNNADPTEVLEALRSGLLGEAEPLRKFGVSLSAARIESEALASGLVKPVGNLEKVKAAQIAVEKATLAAAKATKEHGQESLQARDAQSKLAGAEEKLSEALKGKVPELTAAQKAQAAYAIVMKDTALAQGDFARTADGAANKQRIMKAQFEDTAATLGTNLLPIGQKVIGFLADLASRLGALSPQMQNMALLGAGVAAALGPLVTVFGALSKTTAFFIANPAVAAVVALAALGAAAVYAYKNFEGFRDVVDNVATFLTTNVSPAIAKFAGYVTEQLGAAVEWVRRIWPQVSESISHVMNVAAGIIRSTIDVISALWRAWGDDLLRVVRTAFDYIRGTIDNVLQVIRGIIQTVVALINGDWGKAWDGIKQVFAGVWDQIVNVLRTALGVVGSVLGGIISTFAEVFRPLGNLLHTWIVSPLEAVVGFIRGMPGKIASAAVGMWDGIKEAFRAAINWIIRAWNNLQFKVPSVDLPGLPKFGGQTIGMPDIRPLAHGGIVKARHGGTLALLGEAGQDEAVIPLPRGARVAATAPVVNNTYNFEFPRYLGDKEDLMRVVREELRRYVRRGGTLGIHGKDLGHLP